MSRNSLARYYGRHRRLHLSVNSYLLTPNSYLVEALHSLHNTKGDTAFNRDIAFFSFREKFSGLLHIFLDGGLERLHRFKLHFRTQELMQLHMDHLAVQIARKVEQMRLDGRCTAV